MNKERHAVLSILRDKILSGNIEAGQRITEISTAEELGVSRTPIRIAFRALENEGLLIKLPRRGYKVRKITKEEIIGSVEVRGVLEGLAARLAAERGLSESTIANLEECLQIGDSIFDKGYIDEMDIQKYVEMNSMFHASIIEASKNASIEEALKLNEHLPMSSVNSLVFNPEETEREFQRLYYAHMQHYAVAEALLSGQGARAEALMKEHAHAALHNFERLNRAATKRIFV
ncbi:GntR family transcriptional regulator [Alteromonas sp. 38]|uniref:GntR family transcriptional regulator n=1 Tax=Alteromonas TaxID=226 RepID=UPI0012F322C6|nr:MULTISPECIES: GntR family transcriptional regulator [Alteromonas]CAD5254397.1 GntR family transcriptional regulator [Alteromonas sp. 154]VXB04313.1 GntR family transcriptional regulator [Alteromonas sp. 38]